ncbi:hypothetical protein ATANTOWER_030596 [Ataeniobius toweri]|uniref:Uncharacterized protein n=1 Tax=Ataeniobius toweri TaxID=208326 RepID=A0ABU7B3U0_9TELE|nr:hypothetical protein [Ataeniobius toweri]
MLWGCSAASFSVALKTKDYIIIIQLNLQSTDSYNLDTIRCFNRSAITSTSKLDLKWMKQANSIPGNGPMFGLWLKVKSVPGNWPVSAKSRAQISSTITLAPCLQNAQSL